LPSFVGGTGFTNTIPSFNGQWREQFIETDRQRFEAGGKNDIVKVKDREIAKLKECIGDLTYVNEAFEKRQRRGKKPWSDHSLGRFHGYND